MLYPISYCIPKEKIADTSNINIIKTKLLSSIIPDDSSTYIYDTEEEYYNEYKQSMFALTTKKHGWDSMRHYEILANFCIPYFPNIEDCPTHNIISLPIELLKKSNVLYESIKHKQLNEVTKEECEEYLLLLRLLFDYTKNYLTTENMAKYVLDVTEHSEKTNILYLSSHILPDYQTCLLLHGFKSLFGNKCHDFPKVSHLYKNKNINYSFYYGKGFTYTNLLEDELHNNQLDNNIEELIKNKYFDIVIYGSLHKETPYLDLVNKSYNPNEIIFICGNDDTHNCNFDDYLINGNHVFVREL